MKFSLIFAIVLASTIAVPCGKGRRVAWCIACCENNCCARPTNFTTLIRNTSKVSDENIIVDETFYNRSAKFSLGLMPVLVIAGILYGIKKTHGQRKEVTFEPLVNA
jgi:hypothetical protein